MYKVQFKPLQALVAEIRDMTPKMETLEQQAEQLAVTSTPEDAHNIRATVTELKIRWQQCKQQAVDKVRVHVYMYISVATSSCILNCLSARKWPILPILLLVYSY